MKILSAALMLLLMSGTAAASQTRAKRKRSTSPAAPSVPVQPAEADASRLPVGYTGHNPGSIFGALRSARASFRKSQFETTPEYEGRVERIVASLPGASSRLTFLLPDAKIKYDADGGAFKIEVETDSPLFPDTYVAGDWGSPYGRFTSFYLFWTKKRVGSGVGRTAFGVRKRYVVNAYTSLRLAVPSDTVSRLTRGLLVPATPASARVMYPGLRLALTGRLIPPYGGEETSVDNATITEPEEAHYFKFYIYFEPDTAVVYDVLTGEVYGSLDLTETEKKGDRPLLVYSEPPVALEDPVARQQRLEEQRRDYPPDHVFKSSEVTRAAVIISKPDPGFTEEARRDNVSGIVRLRAVLKHDGTVEIIEVLKGLPQGLTERAVAAAKQIRFRPAVRNDRAVSQFITLDYNFNIY